MGTHTQSLIPVTQSTVRLTHEYWGHSKSHPIFGGYCFLRQAFLPRVSLNVLGTHSLV